MLHIARAIRLSRRLVGLIMQFNLVNPYQSIIMSRQYAHMRRKVKGGSNEISDIAVVVHLYYTESWPLIRKKLTILKDSKFDLYVTVPKHNLPFAEEIRKDFKDVIVLEVPNRGRDVLPFIMLAKELRRLGYEYLLKLHSKKSTHRTDGLVWLEDILNNLLPNNSVALDQLMESLQRKDTGIAGPNGQYVSLTVNFEANGTHMSRVVNRLYSRDVSYDVLQKRRAEFGFFGGTMFWSRLDALSPLLDLPMDPIGFETEAGQIDGTFAHALERLFSIIPEIDGRKMYTVNPKGIQEISYDAGVVPDWADVYIGPKS